MKTIKLGEMKNMDGTTILDGDNPFTRQDAFVSLLARYSAPSGLEDIRAWKLGMKILDEKGEAMDLEDAEADLLSAACEHNGPRYLAPIRAQLLLDLQADTVGQS